MTIRNILLIFLVWAVVLSACGFQKTPTAAPTQNPSVVLTGVAQTALARYNAVSSATLAAPTATSTALATTAAPTRTFSAPAATQPAAVSTSTPTSAAATNTGSTTGDKAAWVADVTIPDGTSFSAGTSFVKTWRVKNMGTTTWTTAYSLVRTSTDAIGGPASVPLPNSVAPGETVDVSVSLAAPVQAGKYTSLWKVANAQGQKFDEVIYVVINVTAGSGTPLPTATPGGVGGALITNISLGVDNAAVTTKCPHTFVLTASFTLKEQANLTYQLDAGADSPGFTFNLPGPQTSTYPAGSYSLTFTLDITDSGSGWVKFHITSPEDISSSPATFSLTCEK